VRAFEKPASFELPSRQTPEHGHQFPAERLKVPLENRTPRIDYHVKTCGKPSPFTAKNLPYSPTNPVSVVCFSEFARGRQPESGDFLFVGQDKNDKRSGRFLFSVRIDGFELVRLLKPKFFRKPGVALRGRNAINSAQLKAVFVPWPASVSGSSVQLSCSCGSESHASWRAFGCSVEMFSAAFLNSGRLENFKSTTRSIHRSSYPFDIQPLISYESVLLCVNFSRFSSLKTSAKRCYASRSRSREINP